MGAVVMDARSAGVHEGYPVNVCTYYLYCDKCGSFNIGHRFTVKTWAKIVVSVAVLGSVVAWLSSNKDSRPCLFGVAFLMLMVGPILLGELKYLDLACRKCGNRQITRDNVLNYGARDRDSVLDVPIRKIIKYETSDW